MAYPQPVARPEGLFFAAGRCSFDHQALPRYLGRIVIEVCRALPELLRGGAVPKREPAPIAVSLRAWRKRNHLSQRQAAAVMQARGLPATTGVIRAWETGWRMPTPITARAIEDFLEKYPEITDPPRFGRWVRGG